MSMFTSRQRIFRFSSPAAACWGHVDQGMHEGVRRPGRLYTYLEHTYIKSVMCSLITRTSVITYTKGLLDASIPQFCRPRRLSGPEIPEIYSRNKVFAHVPETRKTRNPNNPGISTLFTNVNWRPESSSERCVLCVFYILRGFRDTSKANGGIRWCSKSMLVRRALVAF